jgi:hypothetical protein
MANYHHSVAVISYVPVELADELVAAGLAHSSLSRRAEPAAVAQTIEILGIGANLATIMISAAAIPDLCHRLLRRVRHSPAATGPTSSARAVVTDASGRVTMIELSSATPETVSALIYRALNESPSEASHAD